jgi:hypothetical protein
MGTSPASGVAPSTSGAVASSPIVAASCSLGGGGVWSAAVLHAPIMPINAGKVVPSNAPQKVPRKSFDQADKRVPGIQPQLDLSRLDRPENSQNAAVTLALTLC